MSIPNHQYASKALISESNLVCDEFSEKYVEDIRSTLFSSRDNQDKPSDVEQWFKEVAQWPTAIRNTNHKTNSRLISWKSGTKFDPENLFFHSVDTSRLLPMALADVRVQWYATKETWAWIDSREKRNGIEPRKAFQLMSLSGLVGAQYTQRSSLRVLILCDRYSHCLSCGICMTVAAQIFLSW